MTYFFNLGETITWPDGYVSLREGKAFISVGVKSSLLIVSKRKKMLKRCKEEFKIKVSEPDSFIFIAAEKDGKDHSPEEHTSLIEELARKTFYQGGKGNILICERSSFGAAVLKTIKSPQKTNNVEINSACPEVFALNDDETASFECIEDFEDHDDKKLNFSNVNDFISPALNSSQQDLASSTQMNPEVQIFQSFFKGSQYEIPGSMIPMIFISNAETKHPQLINSLTGKIHRIQPDDLKPVSEANRIPDDTKLKIVYSRNTKIYYKDITRESKVWYLRKNDKAFYPCVVRVFSPSNRTLKCGNLEIEKVDWSEIFPIESSDLIRDLGVFMTKDDINNNLSHLHKPIGRKSHTRKRARGAITNEIVAQADIENRQKVQCLGDDRITELNILNSPPDLTESDLEWIDNLENSTDLSLLLNEFSESVGEQLSYDDHTLDSNGGMQNTESVQFLYTNYSDYEGVNNLGNGNDNSVNNRIYHVGDQLSHGKDVYFLIRVSGKTEKLDVVNSATGEIKRLSPRKFKSTAEPQIPLDTRMTADGKLKIILPKVHVLYLHSDKIYYPCAMVSMLYGRPIEIYCIGLGLLKPEWDDIFPILSLSLLPKPLKVRGISASEEVTLEKINHIIYTGKYIN